MRRWNGWGDDGFSMETPGSGLAYLNEKIPAGNVLADSDLKQVCDAVPASRLPEHALITTAVEDRVRHARGQSLPDCCLLYTSPSPRDS